MKVKGNMTEKEITAQVDYIKKNYSGEIDTIVVFVMQELMKTISKGGGMQEMIGTIYKAVAASFQTGYQAHIEEVAPKQEEK